MWIIKLITFNDNEVVQMLCLIGAHLYIIHGFKWILEAETSCRPHFRSVFAHILKARQITTPICLFFVQLLGCAWKGPLKSVL